MNPIKQKARSAVVLSAEIATAQVQRESFQLQQQLDELNAKQTEPGLVMTLGDLLFSNGRSELRTDTAKKPDKLAMFLQPHPDRDVLIEGHDGDVGSTSANLRSSQRRADSVMSYLQGQAISASRLGASGKGEASPVAGNDSACARQTDPRVEVIIRTTSSAQY